MKKTFKPAIVIIPLILIAVFLLLFNQGAFSSEKPEISSEQEANKAEENLPTEKEVRLEITPDSTYGQLMTQANIDGQTATEIFDSAASLYDLSKIRVGRYLELYYDLADQLIRLEYQIDSEEKLIVSLNNLEVASLSDTTEAKEKWQAERILIPYEVRQKTVEGKLENSLYQWALDNQVDERAIIELADAFQWTIDFAMDPRVDDTFKFIYEERYLDGEYIMPGQILAAKYVNVGTEHRIYYFEESEDNVGFFDPEGNSVRKMLLKAPIQYKYITSGFTTGLRCLEAYGLCTGHRAVDYAAPIGTPIRSVGDGTVTQAGWNSGGYGNLTSVRHNGTFSTNYAHQSKIAVRVGQKVKQGEIIGYVGSTGLSTGPHLHYELVKNGVKVNPLEEVLPPGEAIKEENMERYFEAIFEYKNILD